MKRIWVEPYNPDWERDRAGLASPRRSRRVPAPLSQAPGSAPGGRAMKLVSPNAGTLADIADTLPL